jgi:hypothetical protein
MADNHLFHHRYNLEHQKKQGPVKASGTALKDMSAKKGWRRLHECGKTTMQNSRMLPK